MRRAGAALADRDRGAQLTISTRARLAAEIIVAYATARRALARSDLPTAVSRLREGALRDSRPRPLSGEDYDGPRLGSAVVRTLEHVPLDSRCLMRSLVLLRVLAARGVEGSLVIAVRPQASERLDAHAWIEVAGEPLLQPAGAEHGRLVTL